MIKYISTRGGGSAKSFEEVLLTGLAPDGGLYIPQEWPQIDLESLKGKAYHEIAYSIIYPFVENSMPEEDLKDILQATYHSDVFQHEEILPLKKLQNNIFVGEQFYGPTIAFKDFALQFLGRVFDYFLKKKKENITIVGATSGDTGSAAIEGCKSSSQVEIFILYPEGRVSDVQRKQMTTASSHNVHNIAVQGTFDDCQNLVKAMFGDEAFRDDMNLSAVNSINWARIMAQIVYYFSVALRMQDILERSEKDKDQYQDQGQGLRFVVPTGNFGNIYAGYAAKQMGLPIELIVASNKNDILTRFFESGEMSTNTVEPSYSPSMDIQISSNFERFLFDLFQHDASLLAKTMAEFKNKGFFRVDEKHLQAAKKEFKAYRADDEQTLQTIQSVFEQTQYILDPHTAVGIYAAQEENKKNAEQAHLEGPVVVLATAHPAKFPDAVEKATGQRPDLPSHLSDLFDKEESYTSLPNDLETIEDFVRKNVAV